MQLRTTHNQRPTAAQAVFGYLLLGLLFISINLSLPALAGGVFVFLDLFPGFVRKTLGGLFAVGYQALVAWGVYALARRWQMPGLTNAKRILVAIVLVQVAVSLVFALLIAGIS